MYITSIDIGTRNIKAVVAEVKKNGTVSIVKSLKTRSEGVKKGEIVHLEEAVAPLLTVLKAIARDDKKFLKNLSFNITSPKTLFDRAQGVISIQRSDNQILSEDEDRVLNEAINVAKKTGWKIIHSNSQDFIVDGISIGGNFIEGLSGKRLEADVAIVYVFESVYKNLENFVKLILGKKSGFNGSLFYSPFADDMSILSNKQRDLGAMLIDIGAGTMGVIVYQDGKIVYSKIFPFGSDNITNDIVAGLKCDFDFADKIKEKFGVAFSKLVSSREKIDTAEFNGDSDVREISKKYLAEIIESRVREMFSVIEEDMKNAGIEKNIPAGVVLTGGGSKMPGILEVAKEELKLPAKIGIPDLSFFEAMDSRISSEIGDPEMATAVGMIIGQAGLLGIKMRSGGRSIDITSSTKSGGLFGKIKDVIKTIAFG